MDKFIKSNPGLESRFNRFIHFEDYMPKELFDIFMLFCKKDDYVTTKEVEKLLHDYFSRMIKNKNDNFANAREVRNLFEKIEIEQANRLSHYPDNMTDDKLLKINLEDLTFLTHSKSDNKVGTGKEIPIISNQGHYSAKAGLYIEAVEIYFKGKEIISTNDKVNFKSINQACNMLFSTDYNENAKGPQRTYFTPKKFKSDVFKTKYEQSEIAEYKLWFANIAVKDKSGNLIGASINAKGYINQVSDDGKILTEEKDEIEPAGNEKRIIFAKFPFDSTGYKFIGIFVYDGIKEDKRRYFHKEKDECILIK
jgi:hypothetical protein